MGGPAGADVDAEPMFEGVAAMISELLLWRGRSFCFMRVVDRLIP
jgi:hypothetical protein